MNKGKRTRERSHTISGLPSETLGMFLQVGNECHLYMRGHTRNTHQGCSVKKVFLEISQNSQENTYARAFFLIKLQALGRRPATLLKKRLWHRCFPMNLATFLTAPFVTEHLRWLFLSFKAF